MEGLVIVQLMDFVIRFRREKWRLLHRCSSNSELAVRPCQANSWATHLRTSDPFVHTRRGQPSVELPQRVLQDAPNPSVRQSIGATARPNRPREFERFPEASQISFFIVPNLPAFLIFVPRVGRQNRTNSSDRAPISPDIGRLRHDRPIWPKFDQLCRCGSR